MYLQSFCASFRDSEEENEDARLAMDDIEKFEAKLRQQEKLKPS